MELQGERLIPATQERTWAALNDPQVLKACIAGCESLERHGDDAYAVRVAVKVGPVSARFTGRLALSDVQALNAYTIHFEGQGGAAGFGRGSADVKLTPQGDATLLTYTARATVGGKLAQIGSRLIDGAAMKIAADFFAAFETHLQAPATEPAPAADQPATTRPRVPVWVWAAASAVTMLMIIYFVNH